jgi:N-methylhydantoinase A
LQTTGVKQATTSATRKGSRKAYFPELGGYVDTPVYDRYGLPPGSGFDGPAIIEERESTVIVGPDCHFHIDEQLNLIVKLEDDLS